MPKSKKRKRPENKKRVKPNKAQPSVSEQDIEEAFRYAQSLHEQGKIQEALDIYTKIYKVHPNHGQNLHMLGVVAFQRQQFTEAAQLIERALEIKPDLPEAMNTLGLVYRKLDQPDKAENLYQELLKLDPLFTPGYANLAATLNDLGRYNEAEDICRQALEQNPEYPEAYKTLGNILLKQGRKQESAEAYKNGLAFRPGYPECASNLSRVLFETGQHEQAAEYAAQALEKDSVSHQNWINWGNVLQAQERFDEAARAFERALEIKPDYAQALNNLGFVYKALNREDEAIACLDRALEIDPNLVQGYMNLAEFLIEEEHHRSLQFYENLVQDNSRHAVMFYNSLGSVLVQKNELEKAEKYLHKALALEPEFSDAYVNLGHLANHLGHLEEAILCYERAIELEPECSEAWNGLGYSQHYMGENEKAEAYFLKAASLDPTKLDSYYGNIANINAENDNLPKAIDYCLMALEHNPDRGDLQSTLVMLYRRLCLWKELSYWEDKLDLLTAKVMEKGDKSPQWPFLHLLRSDDIRKNYEIAASWGESYYYGPPVWEQSLSHEQPNRLIIGFLSSNFKQHAMAHLFLGFLRNYDRSNLKIICFNCGQKEEGRVSEQIQELSDDFVDLGRMGNKQAAQRIAQDQVHVLVDLMGYTKDHRIDICAHRPAPIQVRYLGMAGTTGSDFFDYLITDKTVTPPEHADYYSETFAYLPYSYQVNFYPEIEPEPSVTRNNLGLPEQGIVLAALCTPYKIDPAIFEVWMRLLQKVPESVLWLLANPPVVIKNLQEKAQEYGIDPQRLIPAYSVPKTEHLKRLRLADLALDTRMVNGAATTSDYLWSGLPVVAMLGNHFSSRMAASFLYTMGLPELVTSSLQGYEDLAYELASHHEKRKALQEKIEIKRKESPLFQNDLTTRYIEQAFWKMWSVFQAGEEPRMFEVEKGEVHGSRFTVHS
jgi:protein O-GlcNAc transferase